MKEQEVLQNFVTVTAKYNVIEFVLVTMWFMLKTGINFRMLSSTSPIQDISLGEAAKTGLCAGI